MSFTKLFKTRTTDTKTAVSQAIKNECNFVCYLADMKISSGDSMTYPSLQQVGEWMDNFFGKEMKILVVDDEKNMRATLAAILEEKGYAVVEAATGERALDLCHQQAFDVVLMDVRMPGLNGVETFRKIRRHQDGTNSNSDERLPCR